MTCIRRNVQREESSWFPTQGAFRVGDLLWSLRTVAPVCIDTPVAPPFGSSRKLHVAPPSEAVTLKQGIHASLETLHRAKLQITFNPWSTGRPHKGRVESYFFTFKCFAFPNREPILYRTLCWKICKTINQLEYVIYDQLESRDHGISRSDPLSFPGKRR